MIRRNRDAGASKCLNYKPFIQNYSLERPGLMQIQGRYSGINQNDYYAKRPGARSDA